MSNSISNIVGTIPTMAPPAGAATANAKNKLNSDMFLQLLVAQLKNQDPSSPMDTNAMITQTVQLSTMEALTSMGKTDTENFALQMRIAAASLVGREVSYTDSSGKAVTGVASAVSFVGSTPTVTVGGKSIALDAISGIRTAQ